MSAVHTLKQAAERARCSGKLLRKELAAGRLVGAKTPAGWRIFEDDLEQWLRSYQPTPSTPPTAAPSRRRRAAPRLEGSLRALHETTDRRAG